MPATSTRRSSRGERARPPATRTSGPWRSGAVTSSRCSAPAGVGKSRLAAEFLAEVERDATVVTGRCLHYGDGITFWPLVEMLMQLGDVAAPTLERVTEGGTRRPRTCSGRFAGSSRRWRPNGRSSPCSRTCTGPSRCSTCSTTSPTSPAAHRSCCSASPAPSSSTFAPGGRGKAPRDHRPARAAPGGGLRAPARHPRRRARPRSAGASSTPRKGTRSSSRRWPCWPARAATSVPPTIQALLAARLEQLPGEERP